MFFSSIGFRICTSLQNTIETENQRNRPHSPPARSIRHIPDQEDHTLTSIPPLLPELSPSRNVYRFNKPLPFRPPNQDFQNQRTTMMQHQNFRRAEKPCYNCQSIEHLRRSCSYQRPNHYGAPANLYHIPGNSNAYLSMKLHGRNILCLLDTGSQVCLSPSRYIRKIRLEPARQKVLAANNSIIEILGQTQFKCQIGGQEYLIDVLISDQVGDFILDINFLEQ